MVIDVAYVRAAIPPGVPAAVRHSIDSSLYWLDIMEEREEGDPRQIQATLFSLLATIEVYRLVAERGHSIESWPGSSVRKEARAGRG
jgi:hypothetical protein